MTFERDLSDEAKGYSSSLGRRMKVGQRALVLCVAILLFGAAIVSLAPTKTLRLQEDKLNEVQVALSPSCPPVGVPTLSTSPIPVTPVAELQQKQNDKGLITAEAGYLYRICDNPITRTIQTEVLKKGIEERFEFREVALNKMMTMQNARKAEACSGPCDIAICKNVCGWSGLGHNHGRFDFVGDKVVKCKEVRAFATGDDEKRFCWSDELVSGEECVVFSIGSANQWAFEEAIVKDTKCIVHTFDCTVDGIVPEHVKSRVTFHKYCVGNAANGPTFKSMDELMTIANVKQVDFLKMDIEGFEWDVINDILGRAKDILTKTGKNIFPNQMAVEFHYLTWFKELGWQGRDLSPGEIYLYFENMFMKYGYALADRNDNTRCPSCSELLLVKVKC